MNELKKYSKVKLINLPIYDFYDSKGIINNIHLLFNDASYIVLNYHSNPFGVYTGELFNDMNIHKILLKYFDKTISLPRSYPFILSTTCYFLGFDYNYYSKSYFGVVVSHSVKYNNYRYFVDYGASALLGNTRFGLADYHHIHNSNTDYYIQKIAKQLLINDANLGDAILFEKNYGIFINFFKGKNKIDVITKSELDDITDLSKIAFGTARELILIGDPTLK